MDGAHDHPSLINGVAGLIAGLSGRLAELEAPQPRTLFGVTTYPPRDGRTEAQELTYLEDVLARPVHLRYSFKGSVPTNYASSPMAIDTDWLSLFSFKTDPANVLSGNRDKLLDPFFDSIPQDGRERRLIYWQESGDEIKDGRFTLSDYLAAFSYLKAKLADRPDIKLGVNLSSWDFDPANNVALGGDLIPLDADFCGLSLFANDANPGVARTALGRAYRESTAAGVKFALSSVGVAVNQTVSKFEAWLAYLADVAASARDSGNALDHIVCYSSDVGPATWTYKPWWLDATPAHVQAWRGLIDVAC